MKILKELAPYIIILVVVVLFRTYIATLVRVNGSSMQDTLEGSEIMIVNKLASIDRYDIVVTDSSTNSLIKRVYGLPGETIECKDNIIYINDEAIEDKFATNKTLDFDKVKLENDEYFLMGDNREVSLDSRASGPFKKENIKGTTNFVLYPFSKFGSKE